MIYRQLFSTFIGSKSLKLSFTSNCVLTRVKKISNWLVFLSRLVRNLKPYASRVNRNRSRTRQAHSGDITNIILTSSSRRPVRTSNSISNSTRLVCTLAFVEEFLENDEDFLPLFYLLDLISERRKVLFCSENASIVFCFLKYICGNVQGSSKKMNVGDWWGEIRM